MIDDIYTKNKIIIEHFRSTDFTEGFSTEEESVKKILKTIRLSQKLHYVRSDYPKWYGDQVLVSGSVNKKFYIFFSQEVNLDNKYARVEIQKEKVLFFIRKTPLQIICVAVPLCTTEEEFFQLSTIYDLDDLSLLFFQECRKLYDKVWDIYKLEEE